MYRVRGERWKCSHISLQYCRETTYSVHLILFEAPHLRMETLSKGHGNHPWELFRTCAIRTVGSWCKVMWWGGYIRLVASQGRWVRERETEMSMELPAQCKNADCCNYFSLNVSEYSKAVDKEERLWLINCAFVSLFPISCKIFNSVFLRQKRDFSILHFSPKTAIAVRVDGREWEDH